MRLPTITWFAISIFFMVCTGFSVAQTNNLYTLSVTNLSLDKGERIVAYRVKITAGGVYSIPHLSQGWTVTINNEGSWDSTIKGGITIGAAAEDLNYFNDFLVIAKMPGVTSTIGVEMEIFTTKDFIQEKRIVVQKNQIILTPTGDSLR